MLHAHVFCRERDGYCAVSLAYRTGMADAWQVHGTRMACAVPATLAVIFSDLLSNEGQSIQSREALWNMNVHCFIVDCQAPPPAASVE